MEAWADELGVKSSFLICRIDYLHWSVAEAFGFVPHIHGSTRLTDQERIIRRAARMSVKNEIKQHRLPRIKTRFCVGCDNRADHYHHHLGYMPPHHIDVLPVCVSCHKEEHADD